MTEEVQEMMLLYGAVKAKVRLLVQLLCPGLNIVLWILFICFYRMGKVPSLLPGHGQQRENPQPEDRKDKRQHSRSSNEIVITTLTFPLLDGVIIMLTMHKISVSVSQMFMKTGDLGVPLV